MDKNGININDINQKLDELIKKNKLLEEENKEFKNRFLKAESSIHNLNIQLNILRKEYKTLIFGLVEKYDRQIGSIFQQLSHYNEKDKKNEIVMDNKEKNKEIVIKKELNKNKDSKINLFEFFESKEEKNKKKKTASQNKTTLDKFNELLLQIFYQQTQNISENYWNELKKLSKVLIIEGLDPLKEGQNLFDQNINNYIDGFDELQKSFYIEKKENIFNIVENVSLKGITHKDAIDFRIKFREKYGITENDINNKNLDNLIKAQTKDENKIILIILEKLNYIKSKGKKKK